MPKVVKLPLPPSANNLYRNAGRFRVPSKVYIEWTSIAVPMLAKMPKPDLPTRFHFEIHGKVNRKRDGDNLIKAAVDACVRAGVIPDDNLMNVVGWHGVYLPSKAAPYMAVWFE